MIFCCNVCILVSNATRRFKHFVYKQFKTQTPCPVYTDSKRFGKSPSKKRAGGSPPVNVVYLCNTFVVIYLAINNFVDKDQY